MVRYEVLVKIRVIDVENVYMHILCTLNKCIILYLYTYEVIMCLLNIPFPLAPAFSCTD